MPLGSSRCSRLMLEDMSFPSSAFGFFPSNLRPPLRVFRSFFNVFFFCPRYLSEDSSWKVFVSVRTPEVPSLFFFYRSPLPMRETRKKMSSDERVAGKGCLWRLACVRLRLFMSTVFLCGPVYGAVCTTLFLVRLRRRRLFRYIRD